MLSFIKRHQVIVVSAMLCLFSLYLVSGSRKGSGGDVIVKNVLSVVTSPVRKSLLYVHSLAADTWHGYIYLVELREENENLQKRLDALSEENNALREDIELTRRLKRLLEFKERFPLSTMVAGVLGRSGFGIGGGWSRTLVIDKGAADGVKKDMPVVTPAGIIGRVIAAEDHTSTVLLLTDPRSRIDVILQRTRIKAVAEGNGRGGLRLRYVSELDDVAVGDTVITGGLSAIFPKGLEVGEVNRVDDGGDTMFRHIEARPVADINRLEEVVIVTGAVHNLAGDAGRGGAKAAKPAGAPAPKAAR